MDKNKILAEIENTKVEAVKIDGVKENLIATFVEGIEKNLVARYNIVNKHNNLQAELAKIQKQEQEMLAQTAIQASEAKATETKTEEVVATPTPKNKKN